MERLSVQKAAMVFFSPHGTTKQAMDHVARGMETAGLHCDFFDAARYIRRGNASELYVQLSYYRVLVIGTPVYAHHLPPLFREMLEKIPVLTENQAAAFIAAYGGVSSGVALHELAKIFESKGVRLLGGMKVATEHCLTFQAKQPLNCGRPDAGDIQALADFGAALVARLISRERPNVSSRSFNDKSMHLRIMASLFFNMASIKKYLPPITVAGGACTRCGLCVDQCPSANITLDDDLRIGDRCVSCFRCVRLCPERALAASLEDTDRLIRKLKEKLARHEKGETCQIA
jgi:ferredoxin/NAD(P)H-dependent FMN reductase